MEPRSDPRHLLDLRRPLMEDIGLAAGAVGLLGTLGGAALYFLVAPLQTWALRLVAVAAFLLLLSIVLAWRPLNAFVRARQGRYGLNTVVMVLALAAILVILNIVSGRIPVRLDMTATQQFTLAPQTKQVLDNLSKPVKAYGFFTPRLAVERADAENLFREYDAQSGSFTYTLIDQQVQPGAAIQRGVTQDGTVVFETEDRAQQTLEISEGSFTTAILQVTGQELKRVCFLTGHGERGRSDSSGLGYALASQGLEQDNYNVASFNSVTDDPAQLQDCSVLVVAGPTQEATDDELNLLASYMADMGKVFFLLDPNAPGSFRSLLAAFGLVLDRGSIIDPQSRPEPTTPVVTREFLSPDSPITQLLDVTFFPDATSISTNVDPDNPGPVEAVLPLLMSSPDSWQERGDTQDPVFAPDEDRQGPLPLGLQMQVRLGSEGADVARQVVIGDSDFARNDYFYARSNGDLFLNSVNWLAEQEFLISVRPKPSGFRILLLSELQWQFIFVSSLVLLPLAVGVVGGVAWWLRR